LEFKTNNAKGQQTVFFEIMLGKRGKFNNTISNT